MSSRNGQNDGRGSKPRRENARAGPGSAILERRGARYHGRGTGRGRRRPGRAKTDPRFPFPAGRGSRARGRLLLTLTLGLFIAALSVRHRPTNAQSHTNRRPRSCRPATCAGHDARSAAERFLFPRPARTRPLPPRQLLPPTGPPRVQLSRTPATTRTIPLYGPPVAEQLPTVPDTRARTRPRARAIYTRSAALVPNVFISPCVYVP